MERFATITEILRNKLIEKYKTLLINSKNQNNEEIFFDETIDAENELETMEKNYNYYLTSDDILKRLEELISYIRNNNSKKLLYLIMFNDVYEYLKVNQICNNTIDKTELEILDFLETFNIKELTNKANTSNPFLTDIIKIFTEYHAICLSEEKNKNKKIIELTNNTKYINKFMIKVLDDIQLQYTKTRKIY